VVEPSEGNVCFYILIGRRGIVTTNPVEQFNNIMLEARELPITDALLILMNKITNLTARNCYYSEQEDTRMDFSWRYG